MTEYSLLDDVEPDGSATQSQEQNTTDQNAADDQKSTDTPSEQQGTPAGDDQKQQDDPLSRFGLNRQYQTVDAALAALPHKEQEIQRLQWERQQLQRQLSDSQKRIESAPPPTPISREEIAEKLMSGDTDVLRRAGYVDQATVTKLVDERLSSVEQKYEARQAAMEVAQVYSSFPELRDVGQIIQRGQVPQAGVNPVYDAMNRVLSENPSLLNAYQSGAINDAALVPILYRTDVVQAAIKSKGTRRVQTNGVDTNSLKTSDGAGKNIDTNFLTAEQLNRMSPAQIKDYYREKGLLSGYE